MLIDKMIKSGTVITLKLTSGEELISKLVSETDSVICVTKPMVLAMGQHGVGMTPYLITADISKDIKINRSTVVVFEPTAADAADQYTTLTTGIVLS